MHVSQVKPRSGAIVDSLSRVEHCLAVIVHDWPRRQKSDRHEDLSEVTISSSSGFRLLTFISYYPRTTIPDENSLNAATF